MASPHQSLRIAWLRSFELFWLSALDFRAPAGLNLYFRLLGRKDLFMANRRENQILLRLLRRGRSFGESILAPGGNLVI